MKSHARLLAPLALMAAAGDYDATGLASWYGEEVRGHTAVGRRFDAARVTAAHRTLPLGTIVEVTAVETGRTALVLIDDRGPHRRDRLIDLSRGAAQLLGIDRRPLATVRVRLVPVAPAHAELVRAGRGMLTRPGSAAPSSPVRLDPDRRYLVQVASFTSRDRAAALAERLGASLVPANGVWRVRLGPFSTIHAQRARDAAAARGYGDAVLLSTDLPYGTRP